MYARFLCGMACTLDSYVQNSMAYTLDSCALTLSLPNMELSVVGFLNRLFWTWHSEVSKMVWHLKIGAGVQKLESFKELWKKVKIIFWNLVEMVSRIRAKMLKILDFLNFCSALPF